MITVSVGCLLIGGGLKGLVDHYLQPKRRPVREHTPVRST